MQEKEKILVVDDEAMVRRNCEKIISKDGFEVSLAENGEAALELLRNHEFQVALMDLKMPGIGGKELLHIVHKEYPRIVPVIITGFATVNSAVESMKEGAYDYVPKPFTSDELMLVVRNAIEKRRLTDHAEALKKEKEATMLMVYHELKAPLAAVYGYLRTVMLSPLPEKEMKMITRCHDRTEGMMELVNDLLWMNRSMKRRSTDNFETLQLNEMLPQFIEMVQDEIEKNNIKLECSLAPQLPPIKGNREDLEIAFINLVRNAIRYNKAGGKIKITSGVRDNFVQITVSDTGIGIPEADLPKIFDGFFRAQNETTRRIPGTGLGLPIVKNIVEFHGGRIEVESREGEGSRFLIELPMIENESTGQLTLPG